MNWTSTPPKKYTHAPHRIIKYLLLHVHSTYNSKSHYAMLSIKTALGSTGQQEKELLGMWLTLSLSPRRLGDRPWQGGQAKKKSNLRCATKLLVVVGVPNHLRARDTGFVSASGVCMCETLCLVRPKRLLCCLKLGIVGGVTACFSADGFSYGG